MYLQFGGIRICENLNELPLKDLNVGDHIVLLEEQEEDGKITHHVINMILIEKPNDALLHFKAYDFASYGEMHLIKLN